MYKTLLNRVLIAFVLLNLCFIFGCHRGYYRRQADAEARRLILEKSSDPRWDWADGEIGIDPQSRMFNPFSEDHPPIPPDDATSHQLMHCVDGKAGYSQWHANGDTNYVENPEWRSYLPVNQRGQVVLSLDQAFRLALLHSPRFQQQRETLYLSALDVSLQRFGFDTQLFAGFNSFMTTQGRLRSGSGLSSTTLQTQLGSNGGGIDFRRLGITGANFAVGLANTILFNFAGADTKSTTSLVDFSIIQPLLRGAGRERIMESLTQSERTLLANVRQMERFRRGFFLEIATGRNAGIGPNGNFLIAPGAGSANVGGFYGLLERQQRIRNQELNVRQLEAVLEQFKEFFARDRLDAVGLKAFESIVYVQQRSLLFDKTVYQSSLDQFKQTLGLPPNLEVVVDDSFLDRFEFVSDGINERLLTIGELREATGVALNRVDVLFDEIAEEDLKSGEYVWPAEAAARLAKLNPFIDRAEATLARIMTDDKEQVEADIAKLESVRPGRLAYLDRLRAGIESGEIQSDVDPSIFEPDSVPKPEELRMLLSRQGGDAGAANPIENADVDGGADDATEDSDLSIMEKAKFLMEEFQSIRANIAKFEDSRRAMENVELRNYLRNEFLENIPGRLADLKNVSIELSLLQAYARSNSIEINDVDIKSEQAIRIARCLRRDWMNARAGLVDNWRNIEFVADQLEAQVDLIFQGDMGNTGSNPLKLRYETGQLRAGFRFDSPIVRVSERNQYRRALISYQQVRRQFYQFEDSIEQNLRNIIRTIDRNKVFFELDRRTVQTSIESVEINRLALIEPAGPNQSGGSQFGGQTSRNLTDAIIGLNRAQNAFLSSWIQSEVLRRNLDFDMGTMQVDELGQWIDPGMIDSSIGVRAAAIMGIEIDCQFCDDIGTPYPNPMFLGSPGPFGSQNTGVDDETTGEFQRFVPVAEPSLPLDPVPDVQSPPTSRFQESPSLPTEGEGQTELNRPMTGQMDRRLNPDSPEAILARIPKLLFQEVDGASIDSSFVSQASKTGKVAEIPPVLVSERSRGMLAPIKVQTVK